MKFDMKLVRKESDGVYVVTDRGLGVIFWALMAGFVWLCVTFGPFQTFMWFYMTLVLGIAFYFWIAICWMLATKAKLDGVSAIRRALLFAFQAVLTVFLLCASVIIPQWSEEITLTASVSSVTVGLLWAISQHYQLGAPRMEAGECV